AIGLGLFQRGEVCAVGNAHRRALESPARFTLTLMLSEPDVCPRAESCAGNDWPGVLESGERLRQRFQNGKDRTAELPAVAIRHRRVADNALHGTQVTGRALQENAWGPG